jgi:hypothetical protein
MSYRVRNKSAMSSAVEPAAVPARSGTHLYSSCMKKVENNLIILRYRGARYRTINFSSGFRVERAGHPFRLPRQSCVHPRPEWIILLEISNPAQYRDMAEVLTKC